MSYYLYDQNTTTGPYTIEQILDMQRAGSLSATMQYAEVGSNQWRPIIALLRTHSPTPLCDTNGIKYLLPVGRSGWAIAAGYLGFFSLLTFLAHALFLFAFPAPICLIVSIIAIIHIQKSKKTEKPLTGMGRAIFGLCMSIIGILIFLIISFFIK